MSTVIIAYLATLKYYFKPVREMPTGKGFADIIYISRPQYAPDFPALVIKLKWDQSAATALDQVKEKNYPSVLKEYTGDILIVGINYDKKSKKHACRIEDA